MVDIGISNWMKTAIESTKWTDRVRPSMKRSRRRSEMLGSVVHIVLSPRMRAIDKRCEIETSAVRFVDSIRVSPLILKIANFNTDFDRTPRGKKTPAEALDQLNP
jgi:hypothetical protein